MFVSCKRLLRGMYRKIAIGFVLFIIYYFFVALRNDEDTFKNLREDISCHYSDTDDALSPADDSFSPSSKSIFFHETSCKRYLTSRELCAIESAARAHPDFQINILFSSPISKVNLSNPTFKLLDMFYNIKYARVHINKYTKNTPLEKLVKMGALQQSRWTVPHTSDALRIITLYKWGGVYLDLDFVVAKSLHSLAKNWVAKESDTGFANSAMAFSRDQVGRKIAYVLLREMETTFNGDIWSHNGAGVITRVFKRICHTTNVTLMSAASCEGIEVYRPELFYPIKWQNSEEYFKPGELKHKDAYLYHVWNHLTNHYQVHRDSPYAKLAKRYCPLIYEFYGDKF